MTRHRIAVFPLLCLALAFAAVAPGIGAGTAAGVTVRFAATEAAAPPGSHALTVSAEGILQSGASPLHRISPRGAYRMQIVPVQVGFDQMRADLVVTSTGQAPRRIAGVQGNGFFISDLGRVVVLEAAESNAMASALRVYELDGTLVWTGTVFAPRDPALSPDGRYLACGDREGTLVLDLDAFSTRHAPKFDLFAVGEGGVVAGDLVCARPA